MWRTCGVWVFSLAIGIGLAWRAPRAQTPPRHVTTAEYPTDAAAAKEIHMPACARRRLQARPHAGSSENSETSRIAQHGPGLALPERCQIDVPFEAGAGNLAVAPQALVALDKPLRILAIGSSSTSGIGASSAQKTYPAQLQKLLATVYPKSPAVVINRGIPGETLLEASARMRREVRRANKPHLVVWQLGTNGALQKVALADVRNAVRTTIRWLKTQNIDVLLIDPQYVPRFAKHTHYLRVTDQIAGLAKTSQVGLIRRFAAMKALAKQRDLNRYLAADRFHLSDLGYNCLAHYVALTILHNSACETSRQ